MEIKNVKIINDLLVVEFSGDINRISKLVNSPYFNFNTNEELVIYDYRKKVIEYHMNLFSELINLKNQKIN